MALGKIYCLMGKSGSGKDTVFREIKKRTNLIPVVIYTTRPKRAGETNGQDYFFVDSSRISTFEKEGKLIECRSYNTVHGVWEYATVDDGQIDLSKGSYIMITTLDAFRNILKYFGKEHVVPVYLWVEDGLRLERAIMREKNQPDPKYAELCRRYLADSEDFSEDRLRKAGVEKRYVNVNLEDCINEIIKEEGMDKI